VHFILCDLSTLKSIRVFDIFRGYEIFGKFFSITFLDITGFIIARCALRLGNKRIQTEKRLKDLDP
jgi:hypothetical protein